MIGGRSALLGAAGGLGYGNWEGNYSDVSLLLRGGLTGPTIPFDESPTPKTITAVGDAGISTTTFKYGDSALAFDGTGDWLTAPALSLGSGAFTIEFWVYANSIGTAMGLFSVATGSGDCIVMSVLANGTITQSFGGGATLATTATISAGQWHHIAYTRNGNVHYLFVDGVSVTRTDTVSYPNTTTVIGNTIRGSAGTPLNGFMDDFRLTKGVARYTANFTPSTAELPANVTDDPSYNSVSLLLRNGARVPSDESPTPKAITAVGNAGISTTVFKYGTSSLAFDGTGDYLTTPSNAGFAFGTGDFTIELWMNLSAVSGSRFILDMRTTGNQAVPVLYMDGSTLAYYVLGANRISVTGLSTARWYHVALSRFGASTKLFLDGAQVGSTWTDNTSYIQSYIWIGAGPVGGLVFNGFIDDLRITKGIARYTKNFLPPPAQLPAI
jgi:hypothetical protein